MRKATGTTSLFHFPRKNSEPCLWFLLRSKLSMRRRGRQWDTTSLFPFPRKNSEPCLWFLLRSKSSMRRRGRQWDTTSLFPFPRKNSEPCLWFLLRSKSSMRRRGRQWDTTQLFPFPRKNSEPCLWFLLRPPNRVCDAVVYAIREHMVFIGFCVSGTLPVSPHKEFRTTGQPVPPDKDYSIKRSRPE